MVTSAMFDDRPLTGSPGLGASSAGNGCNMTPLVFGMSTHQRNQYMGELSVAPLGGHPRLTAVGGGMPIILDGQLAGGIVISGGTAAQES
jgi:uncharacterized protein GlcG (DUF336 family)